MYVCMYDQKEVKKYKDIGRGEGDSLVIVVPNR